MINPWIILGVLIAWIGSLVSVGYWQNGVGEESERVIWQGKENKEIKDANAKILELTYTARDKENKHNVALNDVSKTYQEKLTNVDIEKDKFIAGVRNGTIVLRQPATRSEKAGGSIGSETIASASGRDGEARAELYDTTSEFLLSESARADKIVEQLNACQAVVLEDRRLCGPKPM